MENECQFFIDTAVPSQRDPFGAIAYFLVSPPRRIHSGLFGAVGCPPEAGVYKTKGWVL